MIPHPSNVFVVVHVGWCTMYRRMRLGPERDDWLRNQLCIAAERVGTRLLGVGIAWDHVHCVLSLPSKIALATVVQRLKGVSAHSWNLAHPERLRWQEGYYARSVGDAELPRVLDYVANQRERHARALVNDAFEPSFDDVSDANERPGRT